MKALLLPLFFLLFFFGLNKNDAPEPVLSLDGTWELVDFYTYDNNEIIDTVERAQGYRQIKMYNNGKVMWTRFVPQDSVEWFGYGYYENDKDELVETLEYGSSSMMKIIDTARVFKFKLILKKSSFSQISTDESGNYTFSENYKRLN